MGQTDLAEEAEFADEEYRASLSSVDQINPRMFAKYRNPVEMWDWRQKAATLLGDLTGRELLDYGCGQGEETSYFAKLGANVTAIDISTVGVEMARQRAKANGLDNRVRAFVMNATPTEFPAESFDLVHGMGILHHVGLEAGLNEVHRVLKPDGRAVFLEPLGSSAVVEAAKRGMHQMLRSRTDLRPVTSGEENLKLRDIRRLTRKFSHVEIYPYHLVTRVRKLLLRASWWPTALRMDYAMLRIAPPLRHFAGAAVIHLRRS